MPPPVICFLSDYGLADGFVGVCHAVILRVCPSARIVDLSHGIAPQDVGGGARVLARAIPFLPDAAIALADVAAGADPETRPIAVVTADGRRLVGPDNGVLSAAIAAGGGPREVVDVSASPVALAPIAATFPGRDVLAPVAAAIAAGAALADLGVPHRDALARTVPAPEPHRDGAALVAHVASRDGFGNLELDVRPADLAPLGLVVGDRVRVGGVTALWVRRFGDVPEGEALLYADPQGLLALAVNRGSAAERLGAATGAVLRITRT